MRVMHIFNKVIDLPLFAIPISSVLWPNKNLVCSTLLHLPNYKVAPKRVWCQCPASVLVIVALSSSPAWRLAAFGTMRFAAVELGGTTIRVAVAEGSSSGCAFEKCIFENRSLVVVFSSYI